MGEELHLLPFSSPWMGEEAKVRVKTIGQRLKKEVDYSD